MLGAYVFARSIDVWCLVLTFLLAALMFDVWCLCQQQYFCIKPFIHKKSWCCLALTHTQKIMGWSLLTWNPEAKCIACTWLNKVSKTWKLKFRKYSSYLAFIFPDLLQSLFSYVCSIFESLFCPLNCITTIRCRLFEYKFQSTSYTHYVAKTAISNVLLVLSWV